MSASPQVAEERSVSRAAARTRGRPAVSVVLVADGSWQVLERSLSHIAAPCRRMSAEVIAMRSGDDGVPPELLLAHPEVRFCSAAPGSSETQLRSLAMREASGDIVVLRRAADVGDARWLDAHYRVATGSEPDHLEQIEDDAAGAIVFADELADSLSSAGLRSVRHGIEALPGSGASSAA